MTRRMPSLRRSGATAAGGGAEHGKLCGIQRRAYAGRVLRHADAAQHRVDRENIVSPAHLGRFPGQRQRDRIAVGGAYPMRPLIGHEHAVAGLQIIGRAFGVEPWLRREGCDACTALLPALLRKRSSGRGCRRHGRTCRHAPGRRNSRRLSAWNGVVEFADDTKMKPRISSKPASFRLS